MRHGADSTTKRSPASLYRESVQTHRANLPVTFPVPGGVIEVATSAYGVKRIHFVDGDGGERMLRPHPRSPEGLRERFAQRFPRASAALGAVAVAVILIGLVVTIPQGLETLTRVPPVAGHVGTFTSPIRLAGWVNTTLLVAGFLAAMERALTLRNHWLIDTLGRSGFLDLLDGRDEPVVDKHMWHAGAPHQGQCEGCTDAAWNLEGAVPYLHARGVSFAVVTTGRWDEVAPFVAFMGYTRPWYSVRDLDEPVGGEMGYLSCFLRDSYRAFLTYSTTGRGNEALLDMTPIEPPPRTLALRLQRALVGPQMRLFALASRAGAFDGGLGERAATAMVGPDATPESTAPAQRLMRSPDALGALATVVGRVPRLSAELEDALATGVLPDVPAAVLSAGRRGGVPEELAAIVRASHERLARRFSRGRLVIAERASHQIPLDDPEIVAEAVRAVAAAVDEP